MEKQLQSKITELRDKEIATIELQRLCSKMEKQLVQQVIKHHFLFFFPLMLTKVAASLKMHENMSAVKCLVCGTLDMRSGWVG